MLVDRSLIDDGSGRTNAGISGLDAEERGPNAIRLAAANLAAKGAQEPSRHATRKKRRTLEIVDAIVAPEPQRRREGRQDSRLASSVNHSLAGECRGRVRSARVLARIRHGSPAGISARSCSVAIHRW